MTVTNTFLVIFTVMTLRFKKVIFVVILLLFLDKSKLLITNYVLNITYRQGADHKKCLQIK